MAAKTLTYISGRIKRLLSYSVPKKDLKGWTHFHWGATKI